MKGRSKFLVVAALAGGLAISDSSGQGSLSPAGAPTPTMKSLQQVEPRTDLLTLSGNGTCVVLITNPGSYYLSTNLGGAPSKNGITIDADDVTLDLNGYALVGGPGSQEGIYVQPGRSNITVLNGTLRDWGSRGIYGHLSPFGRFIGLRALNNDSGLSAGVGSVVKDCHASGSVNVGIGVNNHCVVENCSSISNRYTGFSIGNGCTLTRCSANGNAREGISTGSDCLLQACTAVNNGSSELNFFFYGEGLTVGDRCAIRDCVVNGNGNGAYGYGIIAGIRCQVAHCIADQNRLDGISAGGDSVITGCHASNNGLGGSAAGIHVTGSGSRIDGNQTRDNNGAGVSAGAGDLIVRNSSGGNTTNFSPSSGANFGALQSAAGATNPFGNFAF